MIRQTQALFVHSIKWNLYNRSRASNVRGLGASGKVGVCLYSKMQPISKKPFLLGQIISFFLNLTAVFFTHFLNGVFFTHFKSTILKVSEKLRADSCRP